MVSARIIGFSFWRGVVPGPLPQHVSELLTDWEKGDQAALQALIPISMTSSAGPRIAIWGGKSLITPCRAQPWFTRYNYGSQTQKPKHFQDHSHFIAVVGQLMRQILVDYARNSRAIKRGGGAFKLRLDAVDGFPQTRDVDLLRLDDALKNLREMDAQQRRLVEPRFLGGLSIEETAQVLGVSPATLKCRWTTAKAYLYLDMHH